MGRAHNTAIPTWESKKSPRRHSVPSEAFAHTHATSGMTASGKGGHLSSSPVIPYRSASTCIRQRANGCCIHGGERTRIVENKKSLRVMQQSWLQRCVSCKATSAKPGTSSSSGVRFVRQDRRGEAVHIHAPVAVKTARRVRLQPHEQLHSQSKPNLRLGR